MAFEHYIRSGQKMLRCGYTTGTGAALAAAGAARVLRPGRGPAWRCGRPPRGGPGAGGPAALERAPGLARCAGRKDGGDDADVTDGMLVWASVRLTGAPGVQIDGGEGVGRVTKPGLDQPVGAAAINRVPRRM